MTKDTSVCSTPIHLSEVIINTQNQHTRTIAARGSGQSATGIHFRRARAALGNSEASPCTNAVQFDAFRIIHSGGDETELAESSTDSS